LLSTPEDHLHDQVLENCEEFLRQSELDRKPVARRNLSISKRLPKPSAKKVLKDKKKLRKNYKDQVAEIKTSELDQRKAAGECQRCAWPQDRKGAHTTTSCFRWARKEKGTALFPKAKKGWNS